MTTELAKTYDPKSVEKEVYDRWDQSGAFNAEPDGNDNAFCIVIPPPNVTAALHLGHALNNTLQDILTRWRRMQQYNTLWMPGTDHAGIATQTVVEKRILAEEGKRRTDFAREEFVERIQAWKDDYEARILNQLKLMGCSCDWRRTRFTMDEMCAKAVRANFFKLFSDGLIYRGKRLVNWDPATQTVLADDEVEHEEIRGHFWYLRYPLVDDPRSTGVPPVSPTGVSPVDGSDLSVAKRCGAHLPHWTMAGAVHAVTFRLADTIPAPVLQQWTQEREDIVKRAAAQGRPLSTSERTELHRLYSARIESLLDAGRGDCYMQNPQVAEIVQNALKHFDCDRYELLAWAVMPNHVHVVFRPFSGNELKDILHSWKSYTAKEANKVLGREGQFWEVEYFDHLIRDEEDFNNQVNYIIDNPTKAGLKDWPWVGVAKMHGQDAHATHGRDARATIRYVTVATTRPETMLGDTAIAMNPNDPRAKYLVGRKVRLPLVGREIPIIADDHVVLPNPESEDEKARFSTGFLKVTPAHDPEDYAIRQRHPEIDMINVMAPDGTISDKHGWTDAGPDAQFVLGMDRFEAREAIIEWFRQEKLLEDIRDYTHQVGHSYRSHVPIEPYLSDQWYVAVKKPIPGLEKAMANCRLTDGQVEKRDGVMCLKGTDVPVDSLAGLALMPLLDGRLKFTPERYANNYRTWLENLRDWPISRQLWWGHQIPVWSQDLELPADVKPQPSDRGPDTQVCAALDRAVGGPFGETTKAKGGYVLTVQAHPEKEGWIRTYICTEPGSEKIEANIEKHGWKRDTDVLDTWFSSALWPFSTLGWPDETPELKTFYPGDVLCTAREIITLWVSRMVMMGQYCLGDIPFHDVFIHAMIQDGEGRKMSKSLGNGIDPLDIIDSHGADAMRFTLASMTTQTQDVRMPVESMKLPDGRVVNSSPKIDIGRNFCNKLWNASRFAMMNLTGCPAWGEVKPSTNLADRWILSRLQVTIRDVTAALEGFRFNEVADTLYHFTWDDFCDWYLEIAKSRINAGEAQPKAIVAWCLDVILRLLHPVAPFITEAIWAKLGEIAPGRGPGDETAEPMLVRAHWPRADARAIDAKAEADFTLLQDIIRQVRNVRTQHNVPPGKKVDVSIESTGEAAAALALLAESSGLVKSLANLGELQISSAPIAPPADAASVATGGLKLYVLGIVDRAAELTRLTKQQQLLEKGIKSIEGKLGNEKFVANAPADVVAKERTKLESLKSDLSAVLNSLAALK